MAAGHEMAVKTRSNMEVVQSNSAGIICNIELHIFVMKTGICIFINRLVSNIMCNKGCT